MGWCWQRQRTRASRISAAYQILKHIDSIRCIVSIIMNRVIVSWLRGTQNSPMWAWIGIKHAWVDDLVVDHDSGRDVLGFSDTALGSPKHEWRMNEVLLNNDEHYWWPEVSLKFSACRAPFRELVEMNGVKHVLRYAVTVDYYLTWNALIAQVKDP